MNEKMIAFCGIPCDQCPAYQATQADDDAARARVASEWSAQFGMTLTAADIHCDGCHAPEGARLLGHCQTCEVRRCGLERGVDNCARCDDYACDKLTRLHRIFPVGKPVLESLRR